MPPRRIVSLAPGLTELCFALGCGDRIVAVDRHSDAPAAVAPLPRVGTLLEPDLEAIATLRPDLVLAFELVPGRASPERRLTGSHLPFRMLRARRLREVYRLIGELGELLGRRREAAALAEGIEAEIEAVRRRLPPLRPPPRAYVELWPDPPLALGTASWIHDLLELAGGVNAFGDVDAPNLPVDGAAVAARDPDLILVSWGTPRTHLGTVLVRRGWGRLRAVRDLRVGSVAVDALKRPGPRLPQGFRALALGLRRLAARPVAGGRRRRR